MLDFDCLVFLVLVLLWMPQYVVSTSPSLTVSSTPPISWTVNEVPLSKSSERTTVSISSSVSQDVSVAVALPFLRSGTPSRSSVLAPVAGSPTATVPVNELYMSMTATVANDIKPTNRVNITLSNTVPVNEWNMSMTATVANDIKPTNRVNITPSNTVPVNEWNMSMTATVANDIMPTNRVNITPSNTVPVNEWNMSATATFEHWEGTNSTTDAGRGPRGPSGLRLTATPTLHGTKVDMETHTLIRFNGNKSPTRHRTPTATKGVEIALWTVTMTLGGQSLSRSLPTTRTRKWVWSTISTTATSTIRRPVTISHDGSSSHRITVSYSTSVPATQQTLLVSPTFTASLGHPNSSVVTLAVVSVVMRLSGSNWPQLLNQSYGLVAAAVASDIATAVGVNVSNVRINNLSIGSLVVNATIAATSPTTTLTNASLTERALSTATLASTARSFSPVVGNISMLGVTCTVQTTTVPVVPTTAAPTVTTAPITTVAPSTLSPLALPPTSSESKCNSTCLGLAIAGGFVGLVILAGLLFWCCKNRCGNTRSAMYVEDGAGLEEELISEQSDLKLALGNTTASFTNFFGMDDDQGAGSLPIVPFAQDQTPTRTKPSLVAV